LINRLAKRRRVIGINLQPIKLKLLTLEHWLIHLRMLLLDSDALWACICHLLQLA